MRHRPAAGSESAESRDESKPAGAGRLSEIRRRVNRQLAAVFTAFALGVVGVLFGILVLDSRIVVGFAVAWIMGVLLVGRQLFRCPLCRASIFLAPVSVSLPWVMGRSRRCPRCRTDFEAAVAEKAASRHPPR